MEVHTSHSQYTKILRTLRSICSIDPEILLRFDQSYREALVTFDMDDFIKRSCTITADDYARATNMACEKVCQYIDGIPSYQRTTHHSTIHSQLSSEMVVVALDGLKLARPITVIGSATKPKQASVQPKPPQIAPSDQTIREALQQVCVRLVHYRGCPNANTTCRTCMSAFQLLDYTPCTHKGDWCTRVGYYPHFTTRLQRKFQDEHRRNIALKAADIDALGVASGSDTMSSSARTTASSSKAPSVCSEHAGAPMDIVHDRAASISTAPVPNAPLVRPKQVRSPAWADRGGEEFQRAEDAAALEQAEIMAEHEAALERPRSVQKHPLRQPSPGPSTRSSKRMKGNMRQKTSK